MFRATLQWNRRSSLRCSCRCYLRQRWDASAVGCVRHHRNLRALKTRLNSDDAYVEAALALDVISCLLANKRIPVCWYLAPLSNSNQVICKAKLRRAAVLQLEINLKKQVWKDWHHQRISAYLSSICFYIFVRTPQQTFRRFKDSTEAVSDVVLYLTNFFDENPIDRPRRRYIRLQNAGNSHNNKTWRT